MLLYCAHIILNSTGQSMNLYEEKIYFLIYNYHSVFICSCIQPEHRNHYKNTGHGYGQGRTCKRRR